MPNRKGLLAPQNTFLDTIATRFDGTHSNFVLGNAKGRNYPIVYCSDGFCELTGHARSTVMSRSCACDFLFGLDTASTDKQKIFQALSSQTELRTELFLYKKNGASFLCLLDLVPIKNEQGQVVLFLVSHKDVTHEKLNVLDSHFSCSDPQSDKFSLINSVPAPQPDADQDRGVDVVPDRPGSSPASESASECENEEDDEEDEDGVNTRLLDDEMASRIDLRRGPASANGLQSPEEDELDNNLRPDRTYLQKRRRSRAVLYHLSGQFKNKSKSKLQLNHLQNFSGQKPLPEYKVQDLRTQRFIIPHYGIMRIGWDWLILFCTFYIAVMVPFNAAFDIEDDIKYGRHMPITDIIIEVMFIVDISLNFRTTFVSKSGQVVYDARRIAFNYLKGWFLLDLAAAVPFEILFALSVETGHIQVHLLKLCRMLRLARLLQKIDRYAQYSALVLALLMAMFALLAHWMACLWYVIGKTELNAAPANWTVGWLGELGNRMASPFSANKSGGPSNSARYVSALYFTCSSLTSVGFGNVSANTISEKIFSVCAMLLGALMHAAVFGNVTAIIQRMYARRAAYQTKSNDLKDFMRIHRVPKPLKQRMQEFFQTMWSINHGIDHSEILAPFPEELRGDIALHLYRDLLSLPVFESATQGCRKKLAYQCRYRFCTPGECLIHAGDTIASLYYISNGSIEIVREGEVVAIMGKGDFFGSDLHCIGLRSTPTKRSTKHELQIRQQLAMLRSQCDVRSLTYCDLQLLDVDKLVTVLLQYPDFCEKFCDTLQQEIAYTLDEVKTSECPSPTATTWPPPHRLGFQNKSLNGYRALPSGEVVHGSSDSELSDNSDGADEQVRSSETSKTFAPSVSMSVNLAHASSLRRRELELQALSPLSLPSISEVDEVASAVSAERLDGARCNELATATDYARYVSNQCTNAHALALVPDLEAELGRSNAHSPGKQKNLSRSRSNEMSSTSAQKSPVCNPGSCSDQSNVERQTVGVATKESQTKLKGSRISRSIDASATAEVWDVLQSNQSRIEDIHADVMSVQAELQRLNRRFEQLMEVLHRSSASASSPSRTVSNKAPQGNKRSSSRATGDSSSLRRANSNADSDCRVDRNKAAEAKALLHDPQHVEVRRCSFPSTQSPPDKNCVTPETLNQQSSLLRYADDSTTSLRSTASVGGVVEDDNTGRVLASFNDVNVNLFMQRRGGGEDSEFKRRRADRCVVIPRAGTPLEQCSHA